MLLLLLAALVLALAVVAVVAATRGFGRTASTRVVAGHQLPRDTLDEWAWPLDESEVAFLAELAAEPADFGALTPDYARPWAPVS